MDEKICYKCNEPITFDEKGHIHVRASEKVSKTYWIHRTCDRQRRLVPQKNRIVNMFSLAALDNAPA